MRAPREKGENGTGMADLVAVVEMVGARIVEIYRLFDKAKTNDVRIEI
jgi:hypothetical protein